MENLRFGLVLAGVAATLFGMFSNYDTVSVAACLFACFAGLSIKFLKSITRLFVLVSALGITYAYFVDGIKIDVSAGTFLFAFLTVSGSLRLAASKDPSFVNLGHRLAEIPQKFQFIFVSLSTGFFALILLNGSLNFMGGIFAAEANSSYSRRHKISRTLLTGIALNPILSPIAIPFVVVSSMLPAISWTSMLPALGFCAIAVWLSGFLQIALVRDEPKQSVGENTEENVDARDAQGVSLVLPVFLAFIPVIMTVVLVAVFDFKPSHGAFASIFLASLVWPIARLKKRELIKDGLTLAVNEATLIGASLVLGTLLLSYLPESWDQAALALLTMVGVFAPGFVLAFFVIGGLLGLQPAICFLVGYSAITSYLGAFPEASATIFAATVVGWALNSLISPVGVPVLIVSKAFDVKPTEVVLNNGGIFFLFSTLSTAGLLTLVAILRT